MSLTRKALNRYQDWASQPKHWPATYCADYIRRTAISILAENTVVVATPLPACYDSQIVVVTDSEEIIASDPITVNEYIRNWGPFDRYLRLRLEVE